MSCTQLGILELFGEAKMRTEEASVATISKGRLFPLQIEARWSEIQTLAVSCCKANADDSRTTTGHCIGIYR